MSLLQLLVQQIDRFRLFRYFLLSMCLGLALSSVYAAPDTSLLRVEVITAGPFEDVVTAATWQRTSGIEHEVYRLDGIQQVERRLSVNLTGDPENAKQIVLTRLQQLDQSTLLQLQQAAMGLAKSIQYGIDRYPAIVFDGTAVVYGVIDLAEALRYYRGWQEARGL